MSSLTDKLIAVWAGYGDILIFISFSLRIVALISSKTITQPTMTDNQGNSRPDMLTQFMHFLFSKRPLKIQLSTSPKQHHELQQKAESGEVDTLDTEKQSNCIPKSACPSTRIL